MMVTNWLKIIRKAKEVLDGLLTLNIINNWQKQTVDISACIELTVALELSELI